MTNPDREELVKLADRLAALPTFKMATVVTVPGVACDERERDLIVTALRRLASSDGGVKGEPEPVADWRDDPTSDERWNAGCDFAMTQLCKALDVEPDTVNWEAATETVDGDVQSVIWSILRARMGEDWDPDTAPPADAGMRNTVIEECARELEKSYPDHAWLNAACAAIRALTAPGATTKSDGDDQPPHVGLDWKLSDDAKARLAEIDAAIVRPGDPRLDQIVGGPSPIPFTGYGEYTPVTVRGSTSDPSSTRSEVTVEGIASVMGCLRVMWSGSDWVIAEDSVSEAARALLDQFEIRRK